MPSATPAAPYQQFQMAFARHIRNPKLNARPANVPARRMQIYNELLYSNLEGFLLACFPICRKILGLRRWAKLVRRFFTEHRCQTPYFREIPQEFVAWLMTQQPEEAMQPEWLIPLAHYEWVELAIDVMPTQTPTQLIANERVPHSLLSHHPVLAPAHMLVGYDWPVHLAAPRKKLQPQRTQFMVYRTPDDSVRFVELNAVSARLLALLQEGSLTGQTALLQIAHELQHPEPERIVEHGHSLLHDFYQQHILIGCYAPA